MFPLNKPKPKARFLRARTLSCCSLANLSHERPDHETVTNAHLSNISYYCYAKALETSLLCLQHILPTSHTIAKPDPAESSRSATLNLLKASPILAQLHRWSFSKLSVSRGIATQNGQGLLHGFHDLPNPPHTI